MAVIGASRLRKGGHRLPVFGVTSAPVQQLRHVVSGGSLIANDGDATNVQSYSRSSHVARTALTSLQIVLGNWYTGGTNEIGGGAATYTASVEYPIGVINAQAKLGGSTSMAAASGATIATDSITLTTPIPSGAEFFVRIWRNGATTGLSYFNPGAERNGNYFISGTTVTDDTMTAGVPILTNTSANRMSGPVAVVAVSTIRATCLIADSRSAGVNQPGNSTTMLGNLDPSIGPAMASLNLGVAGQKAGDLPTNGTRRLAIANAYFTDAIVELGINDLRVDAITSVQLLARRQMIFGLLSGLRLWGTTLEPVTTSTDNWTTTANQTVLASEPQRVAFNTAIRAGETGTAGYFEVADFFESARNSGLWNVTFGSMTSDGIHQNAMANLRFAASGSIDPTRLGGVVPAAWTITDAGTALVGYLTAKSGVSVTSGLATAIMDSVSGASLSQATTANQPAYSTTSFNGFPGLTFDGVNDNLQISSVPTGWPVGANDGIIMSIVRNDALASNAAVRQIFAYGSSGTGRGSREIGRFVVSGVNVGRATNATQAITSSGDTMSGYHLLTGRFSTPSSGFLKIGLDVDDPTDASQTSAGTMATTTTRTRLGSNADSTAAFYWSGAWGAAVVLSGYVSVRTLDKAQAWITNDFGLKTTLMLASPYLYSTPPE
jgi:hypothetical protein